MTEFLLVVAIPLAWAMWELVSLSRHRADKPDANAAPHDDPPADDDPSRADGPR